MLLKNSLNQSHSIMKKVIKEGSIAIDATTGNGNDTVFLASLVGEKGFVYGFDIQKCALDEAKSLIIKKNYTDRVKLIWDGHENIDKYINSQINGVMFNLGYLPKGDHKISTNFQTTKMAIEKSLKILKKNGIITIVIYQGGDSGFEEKEKLLLYLSKLDCKKYYVLKSDFINQINHPPILIIIEKNI